MLAAVNEIKTMFEIAPDSMKKKEEELQARILQLQTDQEEKRNKLNEIVDKRDESVKSLHQMEVRARGCVLVLLVV